RSIGENLAAERLERLECLLGLRSERAAVLGGFGRGRRIEGIGHDDAPSLPSGYNDPEQSPVAAMRPFTDAAASAYIVRAHPPSNSPKGERVTANTELSSQPGARGECAMTSIAEVRPESERIEYLLRRDGYEKTRKWVERTIAIYRAELDHGHQGSDPGYRPRFEKAVREFE